VRISELHPGPGRPSAGQGAAGLTIATGPEGLRELRSGVSRPEGRPGVCRAGWSQVSRCLRPRVDGRRRRPFRHREHGERCSGRAAV